MALFNSSVAEPIKDSILCNFERADFTGASMKFIDTNSRYSGQGKPANTTTNTEGVGYDASHGTEVDTISITFDGTAQARVWRGTHFRGAIFTNAHISGDLSSCDFEDATLQGAVFTALQKADEDTEDKNVSPPDWVRGHDPTNLDWCNLQKADLSNAILTGATFHEANLTNAITFSTTF